MNSESKYKISGGGELSANANKDWYEMLNRLMSTGEGRNKHVTVEHGSITGKDIGFSWTVNDNHAQDYSHRYLPYFVLD